MFNMKKILVVGTALLVLTGCGNTQTLTCSLVDEDANSSAKVVSEYKDDKITKFTMETILDFGMEMSESDLESLCAESEGTEGLTCKATQDGTKITLTIGIDMEKADADTLSDLNYEDTSYEEMKADLEAENFTCK